MKRLLFLALLGSSSFIFAKDPFEEEAIGAPNTQAPMDVTGSMSAAEAAQGREAAKKEATPRPLVPTALFVEGHSFSVPADIAISAEQLAGLSADIKEGRVKRVSFEDHREIGDSQLALLAGHSGILGLNLKGTSVQTEGLKALATMRGLEELDLTDTAILNDGLSSLAGLSKLRVLRLSNTPIDDAGVWKLRPLKNVEDLSLSGTGISGKALSALDGMLKLQTLDLGETKVGDGFEALRSLKKLENLHVNDSLVTDESLLPIRWLPGLRFLNVSCTKTTDKTLTRFSMERGIQVLNACGR